MKRLADVNCIRVDFLQKTICLLDVRYDNDEIIEIPIAVFEFIECPHDFLNWSERYAESFHVQLKGDDRECQIG